MISSPPHARLADTLSVVASVLQHICRRLPQHISREDLASAGKVALVEALLRFRGPDSEARAFCYARVRGAVLDELRRLDPLSRRTRARVNQVAGVAATLMFELGREPADFEVAAATGLTLGAVREASRFAAHETCSIEESGLDLHDGSATCPAEAAANDDATLSVHAALDRLPANQALALRRYYIEDATLDEIAQELGVSRERARQVREAGEKKLRADLVVLALWQSFFIRR